MIFEVNRSQVPTGKNIEKHTINYEFSNSNVNKFVDELQKKITYLQPWPSLQFSEFTSIFGSVLDATCKLDKPKVTKRTPLNNPWITESIIAAIDRKHELKRDWTSTITKTKPDGDPLLHKVFADYRKILNGIIKTAKITHNCSRIHDSKDDRKKTWKIINELRGKTKKGLKPPFIIDNEMIVNRRFIANGFNKYFNSIASCLNDSVAEQLISESKFGSFEDFIMPANHKSIFLNDSTTEEILKIISEFDNSKASDIPIKVVKKCAHVIAPKLADYFNILMNEGVFPDVLKVGKITPIYKKGNAESLENYRPVSILPIFGKIFEKVIYNRLYNFATSQNILYDKQFGFRKSHSTGHAVNYSISIIENSVKKKHNHMLAVFIDF